MTASLEFKGRSFSVPAHTVAVADSGERLALATLTGGAVFFGRDLVADSLEVGAVDLSLVRTGRAPLLIEHCHTVDALIGMVVDAEIDGPTLRALVRFAHCPQADRLWHMLQDGFPLSLSAGSKVQCAEILADTGDHRLIKVSSWQLRELSVCVFGKDEAAHFRKLKWDENAAEIVAGMVEGRGGAKRAAVEGGAASRLVAALGSPCRRENSRSDRLRPARHRPGAVA